MDEIITIAARLLLFPPGIGSGRRTPAVSGIYRPGIFIDGHGIWTCGLDLVEETGEKAEFPFDRWCDVIATLRASTHQKMLESSVTEFSVKEGSRTVGLIEVASVGAKKSDEVSEP